jgi:hypothetical protein
LSDQEETEGTYGSATVYAPTIEYLELCTPMAVSMAFKNAFKKNGSLFGKDLNREAEEELPEIPVDRGESYPDMNPQEFNDFKDSIINSYEFREDAEEAVRVSKFKDIWEFKNICKSKPSKNVKK